MMMAWLKQQMEARGVSQRELAGVVGMTEQMFSNVMNGRRSFKALEVDAIRRFFGFQLPEDAQVPIAVVGRVAAGDHIDLVDDHAKGAGLYSIVRPAWVPVSGYVAAEISGSSAEPWALDGDVIFWSRRALAVLDSDLGRPVVAETEDGRVMLKRLGSGTKPGTWSLLSLNPTHPSLMDVRLSWAARVLPPLRREDVIVANA
jgi:transcriptional regulator with XRE-family HTH domain